MIVWELLMQILLIKTVQSISAKIYYVLFTRYHQKEAQLVGLLFIEGVLEFVVKILDKYTCKEFLKIPF